MKKATIALVVILFTLLIVNPGSPRNGRGQLGDQCEPATLRAKLLEVWDRKGYWEEQTRALKSRIELDLASLQELASKRAKDLTANKPGPPYQPARQNGQPLSLEQQFDNLPGFLRYIYDLTQQQLVDDARWASKCRDVAMERADSSH